MFVQDYANILVKLIAIFSVINRVPATTHAHNRFLMLRSCAYLNSLGKFDFCSENGL